MPEEKDNLSQLQQQALDLLAQGVTVVAAARTLGLHRTTIHYWRRTNADFAATLDYMRKLRTEALEFDWEELRATAVDTLHDLMTNPETPPSIRLRAAQTVLKTPAAASPEKEIHHLSSLLSKNDEAAAPEPTEPAEAMNRATPPPSQSPADPPIPATVSS